MGAWVASLCKCSIGHGQGQRGNSGGSDSELLHTSNSCFSGKSAGFFSAGLLRECERCANFETDNKFINQQLRKIAIFRNHAKCMTLKISTCKLRVLPQA
jgi:hypothetical protein